MKVILLCSLFVNVSVWLPTPGPDGTHKSNALWTGALDQGEALHTTAGSCKNQSPNSPPKPYNAKGAAILALLNHN